MKLQATATFRPRGDMGRFVEARITPGVRAAVVASSKLIEDTAKLLCPRDTGALAESITTEIRETEKTITGIVSPHMPYAAFVEFGTGIVGAGSAGAGPGPYSSTWPGMVAQPYMRPALDSSRGAVSDLFRSEISVALR